METFCTPGKKVGSYNLELYDPKFFQECVDAGDTDDLYEDATFDPVPNIKGVAQVLTIMIKKNGKVLRTSRLMNMNMNVKVTGLKPN